MIICLQPLILSGVLWAGWWAIHQEPAAEVSVPGALAPARSIAAVEDVGPVNAADDDQELSRLQQSVVDALPSFRVESEDLRTSRLNIRQLELDATDVDFNLRELFKGEEIRINSFGTARLMLKIDAAELQSRIVPLIEKKGYKDVQISFGNNTVKITAKKKMKLLGSVKLAATGQFHIIGDSGLGLKITELETGLLNVGVSNLDIMFEEELPALDFGGSFARIVIDELEITSEYLRLTTHAEEIVGGGIPRGAITVL